jgi:RNA polymerase sigma-70 factor (ECF subfamily)
MTPSEQEQLLARIRAKDEAALAEFVRGELPRVHRLCLSLCRRESEADDLCQETFVRALRALPSFRGESQLSTWLHRIAVNTWKNAVRYDKRRQRSMHISLDGNGRNREDDAPPPELPDNGPSPEDWFEASESHRDIMRALNRLEPEQKAIVVLRDIEARSYEEIAEIMDTHIGTVKSRLSRARERLRDVCYRMRINIV